MSPSFTSRAANAAPGLDRVAAKLQPRVRGALVSRPRLHDALDGTWLGVPLHPVLTDVPVGAWTTALSLDAISILTSSRGVGGAADGALAIGIAGAVPAAVTGTSDWRDLSGDAMKAAQLDGTPVLLTRSAGGQICATANTCSHLGGPLAEGSREGDAVRCPWHGSRFYLCSGRVIEGPAVFPQPRYEARVSGGKIELRAKSD